MNISFIITSYNIEAYIEKCLQSVADVVRSGDEIIVVDDGSSDETVAVIEAFLTKTDFPPKVTHNKIFLGENTPGGVGVAGNIGMNAARKECVFFVDGDDWLDVEGFNAARQEFEWSKSDILIANYKEFDEKNEAYKTPADFLAWNDVDNTSDSLRIQLQALAMIAVPWRKFYRRDFLNTHNLRFPEGDFFFEDNPFHWAVCMSTDKIAFANVNLCFHRTNRPGQTMASTGKELIAFMDHFETIQNSFTKDTPEEMRHQLLGWLIGNMSWHIGRLQPKIAPLYFKRAEKAIKSTEGVELNHPSLDKFDSTEIGTIVSLLSEDGWLETFNFFMHQLNQKKLKNVADTMSKELKGLKQDLSAIRSASTTVSNSMYFQALSRLGR